ncbi:hypothetical protein TNCV_5107081 [Trichonephila clavipes]|uniref:Uncharacterized protein n=1 Tax=Trichonephila clavipes TaxID=2585209 RepID=A0A8X6UX43_TRICX|nr:hypothetical protein TNCV_5107081 [Trichonephila clavipes]
MHHRSTVGDGRFLPTSSDVTNQWPGLVSRMCWKQGLVKNVGASRFVALPDRQGCILTRTVESNQGGRFDGDEFVADSFRSGAKDVGANRRVARHMGRSEMWPLENAGKNEWVMADFSVTMVAVALGPQQIGRID